MQFQAIEAASLKAWPALEEAIYDGWILRFAEGYTKRANSINPYPPSTIELETKISHCERLYNERSLPTIFRITPFVSPKNLDPFLEARGYKKIDPTWVLTLDHINLDIQPPLREEMLSKPPEHWLDIFCVLRGDSVEDHQVHKKILEAIPSSKIFAILVAEKNFVAACVGSIIDGKFGMFDLLTASGDRRKGYGTALVLSLMQWAQERDAHTAYLQVMESNQAAKAFYHNFGFKEAYLYWYRKLDL